MSIGSRADQFGRNNFGLAAVADKVCGDLMAADMPQGEQFMAVIVVKIDQARNWRLETGLYQTAADINWTFSTVDARCKLYPLVSC